MFMMRMVARSLVRQLKKRVLIALVVCLSACVSVSMLSVVYDVGDKINAELSSYGSNIVVQPKSSAVVNDLYASREQIDTNGSGSLKAAESHESTASLKESDAAKIKMIFWAFNITNFAPKIKVHANLEAKSSGDLVVPIIGTWFNRKLALASGETTVVGVRGLRSWWKINAGRWAKDNKSEAMVGAQLAEHLHLKIGQRLRLIRDGREVSLRLVGIYDSGDDDNNAIYASSSDAQSLANKPNKVDSIEVKALTTPENDLARKAAKIRQRSARKSGKLGIARLTRVRLLTKLRR